MIWIPERYVALDDLALNLRSPDWPSQGERKAAGQQLGSGVATGALFLITIPCSCLKRVGYKQAPTRHRLFSRIGAIFRLSDN